ncbi:MAG: hypothetical protein SNJ64_07080 [Endomicrobiia bacterium]
MKKFIKSLAIFSIFSIFFYVILIIIWGNYFPSFLKQNLVYKIGAYGHLFSRLKEVKSTNTIDILFLGSSHTYRGFDSRIFKRYGYETFNLGSSSNVV